jgi:hypothetical protein
MFWRCMIVPCQGLKFKYPSTKVGKQPIVWLGFRINLYIAGGNLRHYSNMFKIDNYEI